jgi:SAM-dependent methyltransferase
LSRHEVYEEQFWRRNRHYGIRAEPLVTLLVKRDDILQFWEQVLPSLRLCGRVLEIGSGSGWLSSIIKNVFPEVYIVTTDAAPSAVRKGIQVSTFLDSETDCQVVNRAENLPFQDETFDYVVGSAVLHHTSMRDAVAEIHRVLRIGGTYVGMGELFIPRLLSSIWGSRFGPAGARERQEGIKEGLYTLDEWKRCFLEAGFKIMKLSLERDPFYKRTNWFINLYYNILMYLPETFVRRFLACSLGIVARK